MFGKFFKKKEIEIKGDLEKAKVLGLITDEEFLELKIKRANKELKNYQEKMKEKKK